MQENYVVQFTTEDAPAFSRFVDPVSPNQAACIKKGLAIVSPDEDTNHKFRY